MAISQKEELAVKLETYIPKSVIDKKNKDRSWAYGYNSEYKIVIISKDGTLGDIVRIQGLVIGLPKPPDKVWSRSRKKEEQYWEREPLPKPLVRIKTSEMWDQQTEAFKNQWYPYIDQEFERRDKGFWFKNNGVPTYITGTHYMFLQWSKIDVGYPDYRYSNRILFWHWEACVADKNSFGQCYVKNRRSGASFMASAMLVDTATLSADSMLGIVSKTGGDAKAMFIKKVVPINAKYPFFFKPIMDGSTKPRNELLYQVPASRITRKNMRTVREEAEGLDTVINWESTDDNAYDGQKLLRIVEDEAGKHTKPNNIKNGWRVAKTCLVLGAKIVGKCMMCSTVNALSKGGQEFKDIYEDSNVNNRSRNGRTKSGLYALFIPMEYNMEGFIDRYGDPVLHTPEEPIVGVDGEMIEQGAIDWWEGEVESKKNDPDDLNEFYRQFPRTESHAFRDESKESLFNLTRIYDQIDYNNEFIIKRSLTRGNFMWQNGVPDTKPVFYPDTRGRFLVSWTPPPNKIGRVEVRNGIKYPVNEHMGAFGCDSYDISGTVGGRGSNGALHGLTKYHMDEGPVNEFFLEYIARPQTAEVFYEDVLMAILFYSMPILAENNKPRLLYHLKNRGYRGFSMNRPDKTYNKLSKTERELGGIPNSSIDVIQAHACAIESYVEAYVGYGGNGRSQDEIGNMKFTKTLYDWSRFDISNRTAYDASISSGLAIMACQRHLYTPKKEQPKISINFAKYKNTGNRSVMFQ